MNPLKLWFARQSLTVQLLLTVPVLLAAVLWSLVPEDTTPAVPATNRPVLTADAPSAQATIAPHEEPRSEVTGLSWVSALRTIVSVAVVIGLIFASARGLKYFMATSGQLPGASTSLKVIDTTYLPSPNGRGRAAIHLIETVDGRQLLVGATDTQLSLLTEFEEGARIKIAAEDSEIDSVPGPPTRSTAEPDSATPARFDEVLERLRRSARALDQAS